MDALVVDIRPSQLPHADETPILGMEVQRGRPVIALILVHDASRAFARLRRLEGHVLRESTASKHRVCVVRETARVLNRVDALDDYGLAAA